MSEPERFFVVGLLIGVVAFVLLVATMIAIEYVGFVYWVPVAVAMVAAIVLAAIAGFICGAAVSL
jgi:hypothetical protein